MAVPPRPKECCAGLPAWSVAEIAGPLADLRSISASPAFAAGPMVRQISPSARLCREISSIVDLGTPDASSHSRGLKADVRPSNDKI